jgi:hypothetical protein
MATSPHDIAEKMAHLVLKNNHSLAWQKQD